MKTIRYPELERISQHYPDPKSFLKKHIIWQIKRDGSNIRFYLDNQDNLLCGSRNQEIAGRDILTSVLRTGYNINIRDLLLNEKYIWNNECIIFGELLQKGKSPTRIEMHEKDDLVIFDMYTSQGRWISYSSLYQKCQQFGLPIIDILASSYHTTLQSLYDYRDKMIEVCKEQQIEGVVGKTHWLTGSENPLWFKEKQDVSKFMKKPVVCETGEIVLPPLPYSEIMGAIEKAYADIGFDKFKDVKIAMPLCARYINTESKKHMCANVKNPFKYYEQRLEDIFKSREET